MKMKNHCFKQVLHDLPKISLTDQWTKKDLKTFSKTAQFSKLVTENWDWCLTQVTVIFQQVATIL
jgi:hypothetical protein